METITTQNDRNSDKYPPPKAQIRMKDIYSSLKKIAEDLEC